MDIAKLYVSQRKLRAPKQIPALVMAIRDGDWIPPILLIESEDGTIQVDNGHHRIVAYWLSGREQLEPHEYDLGFREKPRPRFGRVADLVQRVQGDL